MGDNRFGSDIWRGIMCRPLLTRLFVLPVKDLIYPAHELSLTSAVKRSSLCCLIRGPLVHCITESSSRLKPSLNTSTHDDRIPLRVWVLRLHPVNE